MSTIYLQGGTEVQVEEDSAVIRQKLRADGGGLVEFRVHGAVHVLVKDAITHWTTFDA